MKKKIKVILISVLVLFVLMVGFGAYLIWGRNKLEIQVQTMKKSPDGQWTAVVQMEVYSASAFVDEAVYAVRLKGPAQKDRLGDLVMNMPVNYPDPAPSVEWSNGKLVVTLADNEKPQYLATSIDGVTIAVQQK